MTIQAAVRLRIHARTLRTRSRSSLHRFVATPKGLVTIVLLVLLAIGGRVAGPAGVIPGLAGAVLTAVIVDVAVCRLRRGRWKYPDAGVITALLVSLVVRVGEPWYVFVVATALGLTGKHLLRTCAGNVFNPAALGLVAVFHLFDAREDWWGALTAIVPGAALPIVIAGGAIVAHRVNRLPLVLAFLVSCFTVGSAATFVIDPIDLADLFIWPDLLAIAFAAGFIVTDPPTSPPRQAAQLWCGIVMGGASGLFFVMVGGADYLLDGVLVGNVVEAMRRWVAVRRGGSMRAVAAQVRPGPA